MTNKKFAWELFKNTGNIDAYMLMKEVELGDEMVNLDTINNIGEQDGNNKNQGDSYKGC